jgi:hypothetical protein
MEPNQQLEEEIEEEEKKKDTIRDFLREFLFTDEICRFEFFGVLVLLALHLNFFLYAVLVTIFLISVKIIKKTI